LPPSAPPSPPASPPPTPPACTPTDCIEDAEGERLCATDSFSDGCDEYAEKPYTCGNFNIPGFDSMAMCCACGGGVTVSPPTSPPRAIPFPPPSTPPARPPLPPNTIALEEGEDLSAAIARDPTAVELTIELVSNPTPTKTTLDIGSKKVSIVVSSIAAEGAARPMIEVDSDVPFASVGPGGTFTLGGVGLKRSAAGNARRHRRLADGGADTPLLSNNGGTLVIAKSELVSGGAGALVLSSTGETGELTISGSVISGRVQADQGRVVLSDSTFADSEPMVMAGSNAKLVVGAGNTFSFSGSHNMSELLKTDTAALLTYSCDNPLEVCQLKTSQVAALSNVCLAGSAGANGVCQACSPGTYTALDDQAECRNCSGGFYQQLAGQTACVQCPLGHACPNGSATAVMCAGGFFADVKQLSECKPCEGGRYCAAGSFKGMMCSLGSYCPPAASRMRSCPAGRYGDDDGLNSSLCSGLCDPGHFCEVKSTSAQSAPCPAGTYNGSHGLTSAAGCAACPAGTRCPSGSSEPVKCAPGTVAPTNSSATCAKCVAGKHQAQAGQLACEDCGKGTYCEAGANAETRCKAGYYSGQKGAGSIDACMPCAKGHACPIGSTSGTTCDSACADAGGVFFVTSPSRCQAGSANNLTAHATCRKSKRAPTRILAERSSALNARAAATAPRARPR